MNRFILLVSFSFLLSLTMLNGQALLAFLSNNCSVVHKDTFSGAKICFPSHIQFSFESLHSLESAKLLSEYVKIASPSGSEHNAGNWYLQTARDKNLHTRLMMSPEGTFNSVTSVFPLESGKPNYIFINHIDVVDPGNLEEWKFAPFSGKIAEGFVWGRGSYDNKGPAIVQLLALSSIAERARMEDWPVNFSILSLSGEEVFADGGAAYVASNHLDELNPVAFFGEGPAGVRGISQKNPDHKLFSIAVSHKRALWLKLSLEFESSGHGSTPPNAYPSKDLVHALNHLLKKKQKIKFNQYNTSLLHALGDLEGGLNGFFLKNVHLLSPFARNKIRKDALYSAFFTNTISLTKMSSAPTDNNSIPNKATAILDCRLMPGQSTEAFVHQIRRTLRNDRIKIDIIKETPDAPPSDPNLPLFQAIIKAIRNTYPDAEVLPIMLQATIDSNFFRSHGYPAYCFVPILLSPDLLRAVHSSNERVPIVSMENGINITIDFIELIKKNHELAKADKLLTNLK